MVLLLWCEFESGSRHLSILLIHIISLPVPSLITTIKAKIKQGSLQHENTDIKKAQCYTKIVFFTRSMSINTCFYLSVSLTLFALLLYFGQADSCVITELCLVLARKLSPDGSMQRLLFTKSTFFCIWYTSKHNNTP